MSRILSVLFLVALTVTFTGCRKSVDKTPPPQTPAVDKTPIPEPEEKTALERARKKTAVEVKDTSGLKGTKWEVGGNLLEFQDGFKILLTSEQLSKRHPNGLGGTYEVKGKKLIITIMGGTSDGSWDGEKLTLDGKPGVKQ